MNQTDRNISTHIVSGFIPQSGQQIPGALQGNPAGVVLDADGLSDAQMLAIAEKIGLSETAFVSRSGTEGFKLDFFTPTRRIAHCGHATIATFSYLAEIGRVPDGETSKETIDGPRKIVIKNGDAFMEQLAPRYEKAESWANRGVSGADVLASLGIADSDIAADGEPLLVNTGNSFVVVGVKSAAALAGLQPDQAAIEAISEKLDLVGYYVYTTDVTDGAADATTRMFAPRYGIPEESATGMAAGPLACVLHDTLGLPKAHFLIAQGHFMTPPSPSEIKVDLDVLEGRITGLMAGGRGQVIKQVTVAI